MLDFQIRVILHLPQTLCKINSLWVTDFPRNFCRNCAPISSTLTRPVIWARVKLLRRSSDDYVRESAKSKRSYAQRSRAERVRRNRSDLSEPLCVLIIAQRDECLGRCFSFHSVRSVHPKAKTPSGRFMSGHFPVSNVLSCRLQSLRDPGLRVR